MRQWCRSSASARTSGRLSGRSTATGWSARTRANVLDRGGNGVDEIDRLGLQFDRTGLDPSHVEQVGDVALELAGFALNRSEQRWILGAAAKLGGRTDDPGERRAQVMTDRRQQRRTQVVAFAQARDFAVFGLGRARSSASATWSRRLVSSAKSASATGSMPSSRARPIAASTVVARAHRMEQPFGRLHARRAAPGGLARFNGQRRRRDVARREAIALGHGGDDARLRAGPRRASRCSRTAGEARCRRSRRSPASPLHDSSRRGETGDRRVARGMRCGELRLCTDPDSELAGDERNDEQHDDRDDVGHAVHSERVDRRREEEVVGERSSDAGDGARGQGPTRLRRRAPRADRSCRPARSPSAARSTGRPAWRLRPAATAPAYAWTRVVDGRLRIDWRGVQPWPLSALRRSRASRAAARNLCCTAKSTWNLYATRPHMQAMATVDLRQRAAGRSGAARITAPRKRCPS